MAASSRSPVRGSDQVILGWSDAPNSPLREELVQLIESHVSEAIIRSTLKIDEKTRVCLMGKDYTKNGIVRLCRKEDQDFILTIGIIDEGHSIQPVDPGVFSVENFITEDEEANILGEIEDSSQPSRLALSSRRSANDQLDFGRPLDPLEFISDFYALFRYFSRPTLIASPVFLELLRLHPHPNRYSPQHGPASCKLRLNLNAASHPEFF